VEIIPAPKHFVPDTKKKWDCTFYHLNIYCPSNACDQVRWLFSELAPHENLRDTDIELSILPDDGDVKGYTHGPSRSRQSAETEGYTLRCDMASDRRANLSLSARTVSGVRNGLATAAQVLRQFRKDRVAVGFEIRDCPDYEHRGLMVCPSDGDAIAWELEDYKKLLRWMAKTKLNFLVLEFNGFPNKGFAFPLPQYPRAELRNRPYRRWDAEKENIIVDRHTAPGVEHEGLYSEVSDYAHRLGIKVGLFFMPFYFAGILEDEYPEFAKEGYFGSYRKRGHVYCYTNPQLREFFEYALTQLIQSSPAADHIMLHLSENSLCACAECQRLGDRIAKQAHVTKWAYEIIRRHSPKARVHIVDDYFIGLPDKEMARFRRSIEQDVSADVILDWFPMFQAHRWVSIWPSLWWYAYAHRGGWAERVNLIPGSLSYECRAYHEYGITDFYTQARSFSGFEMNYLALAEWGWNHGTQYTDDWLKRAFTFLYELPWEPAMEKVVGALNHGWGYVAAFVDKRLLPFHMETGAEEAAVPEEYRKITDVNRLIRSLGSGSFWERFNIDEILNYAEDVEAAIKVLQGYLDKHHAHQNPSLLRWLTSLQRIHHITRAIIHCHNPEEGFLGRGALSRALEHARTANQVAQETDRFYYLNYVDHNPVLTEYYLETRLGEYFAQARKP